MAPLERVRVMLVDHDDRFRGLVRRMLDDDGFSVVLDSADPEAAAREVTSADPDVVVIDYTLGGGDGLRLADDIRSERPDQPVVILSSLFDLTLRRRAEERGYHYVEKVDGIEILERTILESAGVDDSDPG